jgi:DNA polymerase-3 subunit delta'
MSATGKKKSADRSAQETPESGGQEKLAELRNFTRNPRFKRVAGNLALLGRNPPQSLLLEGGSAGERLLAAVYWAALLNCASPGRPAAGKLSPPEPPCLNCPACLHFLALTHRDLFFFDGNEGSITIEKVEASGISASLGERPASATYRMVLFYESQAFNDFSAKALLKALEEPLADTRFILTVPQRERLLPTLVSRSWILTLPWSRAPQAAYQPDRDAAAENGEDRLPELAGSLLDFALGKASAWMELGAQKGVLDKELALRLVLFCQHALLQALSGRSAREADLPESSMARAFAALLPAKLRIVNEALAECQDCIGDNLKVHVNPVLTLNWLATRLFFIFNSRDRVKSP